MNFPVARRNLNEVDRDQAEKAFAWAKRPDVNNVANGIYYDDPLAGPGGIWVYFYTFPNTPEKDIQKAIREVVSKRDVVGVTIFTVPQDFGSTGQ